MRRPSPLPPSHARPPSPAASTPILIDEEIRPSPDDPAVIPLLAPGYRQEGVEVDAEERRPASMRELWRASRAHRRALRAEVRRFTVRQRRRRMIWLGALGAFLLMVLTTVGAAYTPLFAVQRIQVVGTSQLDAVEVAAALDAQLGTPLPLVDDSAIKAALVRFPLVESYSLEARPPHDLIVRIVERTPIGVIESAAGFTLVDAAGVALSTTVQPPPGQAVLSVPAGPGSAAFDALGRVIRALPEGIRAQVTAARATTADDVTLTLGASGTTVVWGGARESAMKALVLQKTMQARPPETAEMYDVSSPRAVVVR